MKPVEQVGVDDLGAFLALKNPIVFPGSSRAKKLSQWRMEIDDAPIFRYLYRELAPNRHLEFGTWKGEGCCYVLEESKATVWTINPPFGESLPSGEPAYGADRSELPELRAWVNRLGWKLSTIPRTDTVGFIGRKYLNRGYGHRVCQIYSDSVAWDDSNFPDGFFDTCLIDGGHTAPIVASDTKKALRLVRPGGLILWHDFCQNEEVIQNSPVVRGVIEGLASVREDVERLARLFWINPSHILAGIRVTTAASETNDNLSSTHSKE